MFTSRSATETYISDCKLLRYNQYHREGKGLVATAKSVPLTTGSAVHRGVEHLLNRLRLGQDGDVDTAVEVAVEQYVKDVEGVGFRHRDIKDDRQQWHTYCEQKALTEGLIRAWAAREYPRIKEKYKVLAVERDIEPIEISENIWWQAKVDAEFQDISLGAYVNYSLKTCASWGERMEESYKSDLQGLTEIWSVEEDQRRANKVIKDTIANLEALNKQGKFPDKNLQTIRDYLMKKLVDKQVYAVSFCYLIKGVWKKPDYNAEESIKITYSPLIRGYQYLSPNGVNYAHSWFYPNPENKSGKSALGKGWEPFNVWEKMGVKEWFEMLGEMQPECGDVIKQQVVTPIEYFRDEKEVKVGMEEVRRAEKEIYRGLAGIKYCEDNNKDKEWFGDDDEWQSLERIMTTYFPHNRKHCHFHFGGVCEYYDLCWKPEVAEDPIGSGLYQIRVPHHEAERIGGDNS